MVDSRPVAGKVLLFFSSTNDSLTAFKLSTYSLPEELSG
jgi:hypothetical protein